MQFIIVPYLSDFVNCFTKPGFVHFTTFVVGHMALVGLPHCITEIMRITGIHELIHWTTPYTFLNVGAWSCKKVSQCLLNVIVRFLGIKPTDEIVVAVDDSIVKKWGNQFDGLGYYPDPTDKNPGAKRRKVLGHCWVVAALLWESTSGAWYAFSLGALLFLPQRLFPFVDRDGNKYEFMTKVDLAKMLIQAFQWPCGRLLLVFDNLYAKGKIATLEMANCVCVMVSRLRCNASLYELPPKKRKKGKPGRHPKRGNKRNPRKLWARRSERQTLKPFIYGKNVTINAYVGIHIPSHTFGDCPILTVIFPQRSGSKLNVFFSTDLEMEPVRLLEIYAARFKIEDMFDELKTFGGFGDYRQLSLTAIKRHVHLTMVAYSILRLIAVTLKQACHIEREPWWSPSGPPSVTRLRRAVCKSLRISASLWSDNKLPELMAQNAAG